MFSIEYTEREFTGYTTAQYGKKHNMDRRRIKKWAKVGALPFIIEHNKFVIPYKEGDEFAVFLEKTITEPEAIKILGINKPKINKLIKNGIITRNKITGLRNRVLKSEVEDLLLNNKHKL